MKLLYGHAHFFHKLIKVPEADMEFSEIAELDRFVGIARPYRQTGSARQYLESVRTRPVESLRTISPCLSRSLSRARSYSGSLRSDEEPDDSGSGT